MQIVALNYIYRLSLSSFHPPFCLQEVTGVVHVLVAAGSPHVLSTTRRLLEPLGFKITTVPSAETALGVLCNRETPTLPDAVVVDSVSSRSVGHVACTPRCDRISSPSSPPDPAVTSGGVRRGTLLGHPLSVEER